MDDQKFSMTVSKIIMYNDRVFIVVLYIVAGASKRVYVQFYHGRDCTKRFTREKSALLYKLTALAQLHMIYNYIYELYISVFVTKYYNRFGTEKKKGQSKCHYFDNL